MHAHARLQICTCKSRNCEVRRLMWSPPRSKSLAELRFFLLLFMRICTLPGSSMQAIASPFFGIFYLSASRIVNNLVFNEWPKKLTEFQDLIFRGIYCLSFLGSFQVQLSFLKRRTAYLFVLLVNQLYYTLLSRTKN